MIRFKKEKSEFESCTIIVNPTRYPEYIKMLKKILRKYTVPEIIESGSKEHFKNAVKEFCRGTNRYLLILGGDGTAHDAINAFMEISDLDRRLTKDKSIGFLRGGSGNGIQDSYEVPIRIQKQIKAYAESMRNNCTIDVDLLTVNHGDFSCYCQLTGFGIDAHVIEKRAKKKYRRGKNKGVIRRGIFNYVIASMQTFFFEYRRVMREHIIDLYDGKYAFKGTRVNAEFPFEHLRRRENPIGIEVGKRPYYAKFFKVCPDVVCNNGIIDVYLYNLHNKPAVLLNFPSIWNGHHSKMNKRFVKGNKLPIERYEVKKVKVSADSPFKYHVDGELKRTDTKSGDLYSVEIGIAQQAISFIVPQTFYSKFHMFDDITE